MVFFTTRAEVLGLLGINLPPDAFYLEILDIVIMSLAVGFIFKDMFRAPAPAGYDPIREITQRSLNKQNLKFAIMAVAPAIVLHEMAHKFVAIAYGIPATFYAAYGWLLFGILIKMLGVGFIFFVPGFVSLSPTDPLTGAVIALAGPFMHLVLWLFSRYALSHNLFDKKYTPVLVASRYINGFLLILNLLPIPGIDGWHVYQGLWQVFSGI
ncbi:MAG TPA: M50 family metallopeptidase [Candidatus Nanoarchaeia archaeon]|nr:M50 family metallopeptidase [Candidatus Nanoarchaeia archaeon]